jgi:elongation of very long chain fatty acids protein 7
MIVQAQFCIAFVHSFQLLIYDCDYPRFSLFFILPNAIFFYYLFNDFYNKAYPERSKLLQQQKAQQNGLNDKKSE